jgi:hypothetical protein
VKRINIWAYPLDEPVEVLELLVGTLTGSELSVLAVAASPILIFLLIVSNEKDAAKFSNTLRAIALFSEFCMFSGNTEMINCNFFLKQNSS